MGPGSPIRVDTMMLGQTDTKGKKEGVDKHDDKSKDEKSKASIWARMKSKTASALATVAVATAATFGACTFQADGVNPVPIPEEDASTQDGGQGGKDAGVDSGHDAGQDAGQDLDSGTGGSDGGHDAGQGGQDAGQDLDSGTGGSDAGQGGQDAGQDLDAGQGGQDAGQDLDSGTGGSDAGQGGQDAGQDLDAGQGGQDAGPPVCPGATTGNFSGTVGKITPIKVGGYSFLYKGEAGNNALVDISCDSNSAPIVANWPCPLNGFTDFDIPQDTKRITIHPTQMGVGSMVGSIAVINH
jgi:hypothetical protein